MLERTLRATAVLAVAAAIAAPVAVPAPEAAPAVPSATAAVSAAAGGVEGRIHPVALQEPGPGLPHGPAHP
ncbi:hypothetical protein [Streptomyces erythrochromogenes]|uniref:hypothetical protein n=1 Tax=Streptomyces erythrochromogenes TaxID=285574 RepID=UPI003697D297